MSSEARYFVFSVFTTAMLVSVLWVVKLIEWWWGLEFGTWGILPQHLHGLKGVLFSPFIHGSFEHLSSNTAAMGLLLMVLFNAYPTAALPVLAFVHLLSGTLVWALTIPSGYHIGASGVIYGIAAFLVASGIVRKSRSSVAIAILVVLVYGSMAGGFFPKTGVSWQSHLWGAVSGVAAAIVFRYRDREAEFHTELQEKEKEHFFEEPQQDS